MKKLLLIICIIFFIFLLTACSAQTPEEEDLNGAVLNLSYDKTEGDLIGGNAGIQGLFIIFNGDHNKININDLKEVVVTKDGIPIESKLKYESKETLLFDRTLFNFMFENEITEPGIYDFTGKYKGVELVNLKKIIVEETPLKDTPANPNDLYSVGYGNQNSLLRITFNFYGNQQSFYISDLTDLELTLNDQKIDFNIDGFIVRYLEINLDDQIVTWFSLELKEPLTDLGTYYLIGNYRGEPFSLEVIIP